MSQILLVILVIASNLIPSNVNKCIITISGKDMHFTRDGSTWSMERTKNNKTKKMTFGDIKGTEFITNRNGKEHKIDVSKLLSISGLKELKELSKFKLRSEEYDLVKSENSIVMKSKGKVFATISWEN